MALHRALISYLIAAVSTGTVINVVVRLLD
jgi:hypothetical protein